jgi:predicted nucleotidyltransferase
MTQTIKHRNKHNRTKKRVFSRKNYNSGDGMLTNVWGPAMWHYLHLMSFNYPVNPTPQDKVNYKDFVYSLQNVLPCKYCRINLTNNFKKKPLQMCDMKNRETFSKYIYELHETINKMLNKKSNLTYCDVRERYEHFRSRCTDEKPKVFTFKRTKTSKQKEKEKEKEKEKGCTEPLYGKKSKCIINIVPQEDRSATFKMDKKCIKTRE